MLSKKFVEFKMITNEEEIISKLIKQFVFIDEATKILDIGSNHGAISCQLQPNLENITMVDVEDFDLKTGAKFLRGRWESLVLKEKFDLIIASHVWGHFHHEGTALQSFKKALASLTREGKLILCYNTNQDMIGQLVEYCRNLFSNFQYDYFDETLLTELKKEVHEFEVSLETNSFDQLADLIQVLTITPDDEYEQKKFQIKVFLEKHLDSPRIDIKQKLVIIWPKEK